MTVSFVSLLISLSTLVLFFRHNRAIDAARIAVSTSTASLLVLMLVLLVTNKNSSASKVLEPLLLFALNIWEMAKIGRQILLQLVCQLKMFWRITTALFLDDVCLLV
ncbi:hypothetical protein BD560DRAFT_425316 [Blakeslea trispora]|nr:hypothetical protein BD560DRAFT_425316 [Blakeslea trispora]